MAVEFVDNNIRQFYEGWTTGEVRVKDAATEHYVTFDDGDEGWIPLSEIIFV